jgi:hypothetical protein
VRRLRRRLFRPTSSFRSDLDKTVLPRALIRYPATTLIYHVFFDLLSATSLSR